MRSLLISLRYASKHLHLAFKDCATSEEVYDTLVTVFLDVAAHYDPNYTKKTEEVYKYLETQPVSAIVPVDEFAAAVDFDPLGCIRVLVRHGYLKSVSSPRKKVQGYKRGPNWPPQPASSNRDRWSLHTSSRSGSATTSRHTSRDRWPRSRARNTFSNLTMRWPTMSMLKDGLLEASPMRTAIGSTSVESVGKLMYQCWIFMSRLMSSRDPRSRPRH